MFGTNWRASERRYDCIVDKNVSIGMSDGVFLDVDVIRPDSSEKFPAIVSLSPYPKEAQYGPIYPDRMSTAVMLNPGEERHRGHLESGDPTFYARRGYAHLIGNLRGTGRSGGDFQHLSDRDASDAYEVIEWVATRPWCTGDVGMFGVSYFAMIQWIAASRAPPHLKCIFAPWSSMDRYEEVYYRGGILAANWLGGWPKNSADWPKDRPDPKVHSLTRQKIGEEKFKELILAALKDDSITESPVLTEALRNPDRGFNNFIVDVLLHPYKDDYWQARSVDYDRINVPCYFGADLSPSGLHIRSAFRHWAGVRTPKRLVIGPPFYLDRPVYQLQYESLRWFDTWLKGEDVGLKDEPSVNIFVMGSNEWRQSDQWPLPGTKWTPFYLHENGLLSEHEFWPREGYTTFFDSPWGRGSAEFATPYFVESTEVIGHVVLDLYGSTTSSEVLWFVTLSVIEQDGSARILSRGWLRGSHRALDEKLSKPWLPVHPHSGSQPLIPDKIYNFKIELLPISYLFRPGTKIGLRVSASDRVNDPSKNPITAVGTGHIAGQSIDRVTVYHESENPSSLLLPVTKGNLMGTYFSGKAEGNKA
ncbi:MAG TPA: CocE/NonD family hydrolase [Nitrososphaerales archaeon]|nr:CocE/NonD family hydrolase [Nitrososphaerales archaeon]